MGLKMAKCFNCNCVLSKGDQDAFKAALISQGYTGEILKIETDLCAHCEKTKEIHQAYIDDFSEDNYIEY